jgi:hypothetical protein
MATSSQKICSVCGTDVAGKPRVKDAQGRYACVGECQKELFGTTATQATSARTATSPSTSKPAAFGPASAAARGGAAVSTRSKPVEVEPESEDIMARIMDELPEAVPDKVCPGCQGRLPGDAVFCVSCGMNTQTGEHVRTKVIKQKKAAKKASGDRKGAASSGGVSVRTYFAITAMFYILVGLSAAVNRDLFSIMIGLALLINLVNWVSAVVTAFRDGEPGWGACGLLMLVPYVRGVAGIIFLVYSAGRCSSDRVRGMTAGIVIGALVAIPLVMLFGEESLLNDLRDFVPRR